MRVACNPEVTLTSGSPRRTDEKSEEPCTATSLTAALLIVGGPADARCVSMPAPPGKGWS
jgi:hypothetical protein